MTAKHFSCLFVIVCCVLIGGVFARDYNEIPEIAQQAAQSQQSSMQLSFDPNDYDFLVYDCGSGEIQTAMDRLGLSYYVRNKNNAVSEQDLVDYDILIVGWKQGDPEDTDGLDPAIIEQGITGRVILTGHDTDWHTANNRWEQPYAEQFLSQSIGYVLGGSGAGLLAHGEPVEGFNWLPDSWGIEVTDGLALENVTAFTQDGIDSAIFDDLTTDNLSNWHNSFHNSFDSYGIGFKPFEMGMVSDVNSVITIAATVDPYGFPFDKEDDVDGGDCRSPAEEITYTICWENSTDHTFTDVWIIDYLDDGVDYPAGQWQVDPNDPFNPIPPDPNYDPITHTYIWEIGTVAPDDANCVTLTVTVNSKAEPGMYLHNVAEIWAGDTLLTKATEDTLVCCWDPVDPNIIYVDEFANGNNTGVDWENAYSGEDGLQKALKRAGESECQGPYTIYAAQGTYKPGRYESSSFALPDGTLVYGGFKTGGCDFTERNPQKYKTVLSGYIEEETIVENLVTMGDETLIDGFTIREASVYGIYGQDVNVTIENCILTNNGVRGVHILDGNLSINWCVVNKNGNGIYHYGGIGTISHSEILNTNGYCIYADNVLPTIKHTVAWNSGQGIKITNPTESPILHNNTIGLNEDYGLYFSDNHDSSGDPNFLDYPDMDSCIVWYNDAQILGFNPDSYASNCCIQDCNEVNDNDNYNFEPGFAYTTELNNIPDPNNYHLAYDSPCKELGNPSFTYVDEVDIDGENRIYGDYVDIGADEVYSCDDDLSEDDIYNALDWNADGILNLKEYRYWAASWLSHDPNDPAINDPNHPDYDDLTDPNSPDYIDPNRTAAWLPKCNLIDTGDSEYAIDLADLMEFLDNGWWLWEACWRKSQRDRFENMMMAMMSMESTAIVAVEPKPAKPSEEEQLASLVMGIHAILAEIDKSIVEGHENSENLYDAVDYLKEVLLDLKEGYSAKEGLK